MVGHTVLDFTNENIVYDCNLRNFQVEWSVTVSQRRNGPLEKKENWLEVTRTPRGNMLQKGAYKKGFLCC